MTKAQIVQNLLDSHQITAEQAVVLLSPDHEKVEYIYIERQNPFLWNPLPYPLPYPQPNIPYYTTTCEA